MADHRRFELDELSIRPGTYFNPETEVMIVVDDSPELDHEIFDMDDFKSGEWVLIADDSPLDEHKRDELVEHFQVTYHPGPGGDHSAGEDLEDDDEDEDDELEPDELEIEHE
jgi:hypothetical protein